MLTFGVLFTCIGLIFILFNSVSFSFIKDQVKDKKQVIFGVISTLVGLTLLIIAIRNMTQGE